MTLTTGAHGSGAPRSETRPNLVRWGAVLSGAVVGVAVFALLTTLWLALAYSSDLQWWRTTLDWWIGGTAIVAAFVAGALAGWLSGARGAAAGLANSVTVWGLVTVTAVLGGIPVGVGYFGIGGLNLVALPGTSLWTGFWSLLIGLGAAALGGALGGSAHRAGPDGETSRAAPEGGAHDAEYPGLGVDDARRQRAPQEGPLHASR